MLFLIQLLQLLLVFLELKANQNMVMLCLLFVPVLAAQAILAAGFFKVGEKAPSFALTSIMGDAVSLDSYKGKVVVLGLFHICDPCMMQGSTLQKVFEMTDRAWRGIGSLDASGLRLRDAWRRFDAAERFGLNAQAHLGPESSCIAGLVLQGRKKPVECSIASTVTAYRQCSGRRSCRASPPAASNPSPLASSSNANANAWLSFPHLGGI